MEEEHNTWELGFQTRTDFNFKGIELTTCLIIDAALKRGIHAGFVLGKYLELSFNDKRQLFYISDNTSLSYIAQKISVSKTDTKAFLRRAGISVPEGKRFQTEELEKILAYADALQRPIVIKPDMGSEGKGVYCDVAKQDIPQVVREVGKKYKSLAVEEQVFGNEYRVFATIDNYVTVLMRRPANVLGDGIQTIAELIKEKNIGRHPKSEKPLTYPFIKIEVDDVVLRYLAQQKLTLDHIPQANERVYLRNNSNISTGGEGIDMTDDAHPAVIDIARRALAAIPGMTYAGIDLMTEDITQEPHKYAILEMNNMPGIWPLHYPYIGKSRDAAGALVDLVFPETKHAKRE
ncbi:ATP-grasp domain-containing protein [Candidatus Woesearchaeota archaeon]|nr:ATP-grasp domain-containing protein [Candidatus Woesearchaeota archaeon]